VPKIFNHFAAGRGAFSALSVRFLSIMAKSMKMREAPWSAAARRRLRIMQFEITGAKNSKGKD